MKQFILFAFSFFILNCNTPRHQPNSIETITYPGPTDKTLTDFIKSIEIVRLQHNDTLIIGDNCNLLQNDSSFYLIDILGEQSVFRFNKKGRFLNRIGEKGKGPQEYSNMLGIAIEESNNHVYIQSIPYFTLANYTKDGNFKEKNIKEIPVNGFCKNDETFWLFAGYNKQAHPQYLIKMNESFKMIDSLTLPIDFKNTSPSILPKFSSFKNHSYFWQHPYPIVYKLDADTVYPILFLDFGKKYISYSDSFDPKIEIKQKNEFLISNYWESDTHSLIRLSSLEKDKSFRIVTGLKNKKTEQWNWIEFMINNKLTINTDWYFNRIKGFAQDGRLMCFFFGNEIEELTDEARKLITNPQELENIDPEMDMFVLLCRFK